MTALYWSLAPRGEHPARARLENRVGRVKLADDVCQAFATRAELARSTRFMEILTDEEDPALHWEIVSFYGDNASARTSDLSEGVYVACPKETSREALVTWLEALAGSDDGDEVAAAERATKFYRENREAWELG